MPIIPDNEYQTQIVAISASISALASTVIIYTILKSQKKLTLTLNRLLLGMSISDIITSIGIAFNTIPIPKDTESFIFNTPYGNQTTCNVQGFSILVFSTMVPLYVTNLCVYYVATIKYNTSPDVFSKWIEPILHSFTIVFSVVYGIIALVKGYINPMPSYCYFGVYPNNCVADPDVECIRGSKEVLSFLGYFMVSRMAFSFTVIVCSMSVIFYSVRKQERRMSQRYKTMGEEGRHTKKVKYQALGYIIAYALSYIFPFVQAIMFVKGQLAGKVISSFSLVLYPLQGLFNFIVFIHPRAQNQRRGNTEMSNLEALWAAIQCKPIESRRRGTLSQVGTSRVRVLRKGRDKGQYNARRTNNRKKKRENTASSESKDFIAENPDSNEENEVHTAQKEFMSSKQSSITLRSSEPEVNISADIHQTVLNEPVDQEIPDEANLEVNILKDTEQNILDVPESAEIPDEANLNLGLARESAEVTLSLEQEINLSKDMEHSILHESENAEIPDEANLNLTRDESSLDQEINNKDAEIPDEATSSLELENHNIPEEADLELAQNK